MARWTFCFVVLWINVDAGRLMGSPKINRYLIDGFEKSVSTHQAISASKLTSANWNRSLMHSSHVTELPARFHGKRIETTDSNKELNNNFMENGYKKIEKITSDSSTVVWLLFTGGDFPNNNTRFNCYCWINNWTICSVITLLCTDSVFRWGTEWKLIAHSIHFANYKSNHRFSAWTRKTNSHHWLAAALATFIIRREHSSIIDRNKGNF